CRRHHNLETGGVVEPRLSVLRMIRPFVPQTAPRPPDHPRRTVGRAPPPGTHFGRVVDQLIEAGGDEIVELHLADWSLPGDRGADTDAHHGALPGGACDQPIT